MQKRKIDELISHFNRKVADMDIDREYKMELLGMITAIGITCEKELLIGPERKNGEWIIEPHAVEGMYNHRCSECMAIVMTAPTRRPKYKYCPTCGADMRA